MNKCSCCGRETHAVKIYKLPIIGYGSVFDVVEPEDKTVFNLCPRCGFKINAWIRRKYPNISIKRFWECHIVNPYAGNSDGSEYIEEFEFEEQLIRVFKRFMPGVFYRWNADSIKNKVHNFLNKW
ncbi:hypothetical protein AALA22_13030 [Anaerovoracaceae bacterium 41-7]